MSNAFLDILRSKWVEYNTSNIVQRERYVESYKVCMNYKYLLLAQYFNIVNLVFRSNYISSIILYNIVNNYKAILYSIVLCRRSPFILSLNLWISELVNMINRTQWVSSNVKVIFQSSKICMDYKYVYATVLYLLYNDLYLSRWSVVIWFVLICHPVFQNRFKKLLFVVINVLWDILLLT